MNSINRKEYEERLSVIEKEVAELKSMEIVEEKKETIFLPGHLYRSIDDNAVVICISGCGNASDSFTGIALSSFRYDFLKPEEMDLWAKELFVSIDPKEVIGSIDTMK